MRISIPSPRNFAIYHLVDTERKNLRIVAAANNICYARVRQIVLQVRHFISKHGARHHLAAPSGATELATLRIAYERIEGLYDQSMTAWEFSKGGQTTEICGPKPTTHITRPSDGDPRYIRESVRCVLALVKIAKEIDHVERQHAAITGEPIRPTYTQIENEVDPDDPLALIDPIQERLERQAKLATQNGLPSPCGADIPVCHLAKEDRKNGLPSPKDDDPQQPADDSPAIEPPVSLFQPPAPQEPDPLRWACTPPDEGYTTQELAELTRLATRWDNEGASPALSSDCAALHQRIRAQHPSWNTAPEPCVPLHKKQ